MRWKWIVTIGVLMIVIFITAVYVVLKTYDYNKLKPLVARMVEEATGRKLSLGGEVNFEIGLMTTLVVTNIALANVPWGSQAQMIEIERLQAQVRLLPLLFKDVEVKQIGLFGVKMLLETGYDAQSNWNFLAGDSSAGSLGALKPAKIDVDRVSIENLYFTFHRQKTGSQTQFTLASLVMNRQESENALTLKLRADIHGQPVTLSGKTGGIRQLLAHKRFPLQLSGSLANAAIKLNGAIDDVINLQGIDLEAQLIGKDMAILEPFLDIQLPNTKAFDVKAEVKGSKESLKLENVKGNLSGSNFDLAVGGGIGNWIAITGVDLKLKGSGKDLAEIGRITGNKFPASDKFTVQGRLMGSTKALSLLEAEGSASRGSLNLTVNGAIKELLALEGINVKLKASGKELAEIGPLLGTGLPELGSFDVSAKLSGSAKTISLNDLSAMVDKSDFNGQAKVAFRKRPQITVRLESSLIDFTALMKSLEKDEEKTTYKDKQKRRLFSADDAYLIQRVNIELPA